MAVGPLVERAERLYNLIDQDPGRAAEEARSLAALAVETGDLAAQALAWRAAAVAVRGADVEEARRLAHHGLSIATSAGLPELADRVRVTMAGIAVFAGDHGEARVLLRDVIGAGRGRAAVEAAAQLGFLELLAGDHGTATRYFDSALAGLVDDVWEANTRSNRALSRAYLGDLAGARADLEAAIRVFDSLGSVLAVAEAHQNLGWVMDQAGDYVGALQSYANAESILGDTPASRGYLLRDRANTLIAVGLAQEAADDARVSAVTFDDVGRHGDAAESRAVQAMALLAAGRRSEAADVARQAEEEFRRQGRPIHADQAALVALKAHPSGSIEPGQAWRARELADRLGGTAARLVALDASITAARMHVLVGQVRRAARLLEPASAARRSSRPDLRIAYWQVIVDLRAAQGDRLGVLRAARAGLDAVERSQRLLGSTEARVNMAAGAERLGRSALEAARHGGPSQLFDWMERVRAGSLRFKPVRPDRSRTASDEAALRAVALEIEQAQLRGEETTELVRRQHGLERALRLSMLEARGDGDGVPRLRAADVRSRLDGATMVSFAQIRGRLYAVRLDGRRARTHDLGPIDVIHTELDHLRFALLRVATGRLNQSTVELVEAGTGRLDELIIAPLRIGDGDLVIVPTGRLFTVPWSLLPTTRHRPLVVVPSASLWAARIGSAPGGGEVVLAAGPALAHAAGEIERLSALHPASRRMMPGEATVGAVLAAADGARLLHVACHGVFRSDNPLFSSLRLADGPLAVHEMEGLRRAPATVVLSACDSGLAELRPGNEWMGMAAALLTLGTRSLVASVMPVPDAGPTLDLMDALHRRVIAGRPVAASLAESVSSLADEPETLATRASFVCMGGHV